MLKSSTLIVLFGLFAVGFALDCYKFDSYTNRPTVVSGMNYCLSFYDISNGEGTFTGEETKDAATMKTMVATVNKGHDCVLRNYRMSETEEGEAYYTCYCFSSMCNFPFSWEEFQRRGKTIAPQIAHKLW